MNAWEGKIKCKLCGKKHQLIRDLPKHKQCIHEIKTCIEKQIKIYLACLIHKAIIKSLSYLAKELAIINIIKIDGHGGVGGSLFDGFNL